MTQATHAADSANKTANKSVQPQLERRPEAKASMAAGFEGARLGERNKFGRDTIAHMHRAHGNQAVLRSLAGDVHAGGELGRKCDCGKSTGEGECAECAEKKTALKRSRKGSGTAGAVPRVVHDVLRESGEPLAPELRAFMEPRFGADFADVRFHVDRRAAESAAAVDSHAFTVGRHIVFGAGQYSPRTAEGRSLIAHELAHVAQSGGRDNATPLRISDPSDASERAADRVADDVMRMSDEADTPSESKRAATNPSTLHRKIVIDPAEESQFIAEELDAMCPGSIQFADGNITANCGAKTNPGCECACDVVADPARTYTIHVDAAAGTTSTQKLADGSTVAVPTSSLWPHTVNGENPEISVESSESSIEFGAFQADGTPFWYSHRRILAHELCGHGRLRQTYTNIPKDSCTISGNRLDHNSTIDTENAIAAQISGAGPARGHYNDKRQGEAFYNPIGDHSKIAFCQKDGFHYEAP